MTTKNDVEIFGGFDSVFDALAGPEKPFNDDDDGQDRIVDHDELEDDDDKNQDTDDVDTVDDDVVDDTDDDTDDVDDKGDVDDLDDDEAELVSPFIELFSKELGWEMGDDEKPKNIKDLVDYMSEIIDANSTPTYYSDEIAELDEFVKNGGDIRTYFEKVYSGTETDSFDISTKDGQRAVVKELLKIKGYTESRIEKTIERYEDAGVLEEEAEDAIDIVESNRDQIKKKLLEDQKKEQQEYIKRQQNYIATVTTSIDKIDSVRGIPITKKDKDLLKEYIFKVGPDGKTAFQKDYSSDISNLIQSAFFTMKKGDDITKSIKSKAQSSAVSDFKKKLKDTTKRNKSDASRDLSTNKNDMISAISRHLIKPN